MLKVASFEITNDTAINELLSKYRIAKGAQILVSNGNICIPYEDGQEDNIELKTNSLRELMFGVERELSVIEHAQKMIDAEAADLQDDINTCKAKIENLKNSEGYVKSADKKDFEDRLKYYQDKLQQKATQAFMNKHEVTRLNIDISIYENAIEEMEATTK